MHMSIQGGEMFFFKDSRFTSLSPEKCVLDKKPATQRCVKNIHAINNRKKVHLTDDGRHK